MQMVIYLPFLPCYLCEKQVIYNFYIIQIIELFFLFSLPILICDMIDQIQFQQGPYFFQIIPLKLSIIKKESDILPQGISYSLSVFKDLHRFDLAKVPMSASFDSLKDRPAIDISQCKLNFYLPNYNKTRSQEFTLILIQNYNNEDWRIGQCCIDAGAIAADFKDHHQYFYQFTANLSEKYELTFFILVEKTKGALDQKFKDLTEKQFNRIFVKSAKYEAVSTKEIQDDLTVIERSQKNMVICQTPRKKKIPVIEVRYKAISKKNAPGELATINSARLPLIEVDKQISVPSNGETKLTLWLFFAMSLVIIYFAMCPDRRT